MGSQFPWLTQDERRVLAAVLAGQSMAATARTTAMAPETVQAQLRVVLDKLAAAEGASWRTPM